ncbi:MAG: hypothetical protein KC592_17830, partial [Nitrospira sp.]|nr:hypothetical protein [Nitrospira sp.]
MPGISGGWISWRRDFSIGQEDLEEWNLSHPYAQGTLTLMFNLFKGYNPRMTQGVSLDFAEAMGWS